VTPLRARSACIALLLGLNGVLLTSCAVTDGGYGYNTEVRVGLDYYDPWYGDYGGYGGWGPAYRVGPPRQIMPRPDFDRGPPRREGGYRPPPGTHQVPTIPSRPHPRGPRIRR
jgi:hypothetical protein